MTGVASETMLTPLISCVMPIYGRPAYVNEAVWMFLQQDYPGPRKELVILNDCPGQTYTCDLPPESGVRVINRSERYATLGEKRNACIEQAKGDLIAVWDDDDVYLPWRLSYSFEQMRRHHARFFRGAEFWAYWGGGDLHHNQVTPAWVSHPLVLFEKSLWAQVGGYLAMGIGEDGRFFDRVRQALGETTMTSPVPRDRRYFILRGKSDYPHMCMPGGTGRLQTKPGTYLIEPCPIRDELLRGHYEQLVAGMHHQLEAGAGGASPAATSVPANTPSTKPILSVCVSLKNRSHVPHGDGFLALFPNCVRALVEAARALDGKVELVVADFGSDDDPPQRWVHDLAGELQVQVLQLGGGFSRGRGLNAAARAARSSRLLLTDADVLIDGSSLVRAMEVIDQDKVWWPIFRCLHEDGSPTFWQDFGHGIVALQREVFDASGGVPEFESWGGEDNLFSERVYRHRPGVRERWAGLRHQWHPEHCRHEHYANPRKWDYEQHRKEAVLSSDGSANESVDVEFIQQRQEVCDRCSMMHALSDGQVDCQAAKTKISLARGQCRLRKWPVPSIAATRSRHSRSPAFLVIATGRYHAFVPLLLEAAKRFFFAGSSPLFYVFSDTSVAGVDVVWVPTPHTPWPGTTLHRSHILLSAREQLECHDFLVHCDADMRLVGPVGQEIVSDLFAVRHPWFADQPRSAFTYEARPESAACIAQDEGAAYYAGAFQGGRTKHYLHALATMAAAVDRDSERGITAIWHDESHWNRYLIDREPDLTLDPQYCCPESWSLPDRRVICLDKNEKALRDTKSEASHSTIRDSSFYLDHPTDPIDADLVQQRQEACSHCPMKRVVENGQVDCLVAKTRVSLALGQCRLRKWPVPAVPAPESATPPAGSVRPDLNPGDSIVLVSNGRGLIGSGLGPKIDRFDQVVRFNNAVMSDALAGDVGTRTTLWVHSDCASWNREAHRAAERSFASCQRFLAVPDIPGKGHVVVPAGAERIPEGVERRVRNTVFAGSPRSLPGVPRSVWCTTGMIGLGWLLEHYPVVHVAGWYRDQAGVNRHAFLQHYGEPDQRDIPINHDVRAEKAILDRWIAEGRVVVLEQLGVKECRESNRTGECTNAV